MNIDRYLQISQEIEQREKQVEDSKRQSYTVGDTDVLRNFKRDAATAGITPMQNWLTHYLKQHAAILSFILHPDVQPSEPLVSRVGDLRTYLKLLVAIAEDEGRDTGLPECRYLAGSVDANDALLREMVRTWPSRSEAYEIAGVRSKTLDPQDNALDPRYNPRSK